MGWRSGGGVQACGGCGGGWGLGSGIFRPKSILFSPLMSAHIDLKPPAGAQLPSCLPTRPPSPSCSAGGTGGETPGLPPTQGSRPPEAQPQGVPGEGLLVLVPLPFSLCSPLFGRVHPTPMGPTGGAHQTGLPSPLQTSDVRQGLCPPGLSCRTQTPPTLGSLGAPPSALGNGFSEIPLSLPGTSPNPGPGWG